MHNQAPIQRRKSTRIYVGNVPIGDGAPIAVQSMTNTRTTDVEATVNQIKALERYFRERGQAVQASHYPGDRSCYEL